VANAPAPYGAPRQRTAPRDPSRQSASYGATSDSDWGDNSWSSPTSFRAHSSPDIAREPVYDQVPERGLPGWGAVLLLVVIAGIGGIIDAISGAQVRGGFNWGIVVASIIAILAVRRSGMFPVVIAPPIVYSIGSGAMLYIRSSGGHDRKVLFDAAANWLVYGFPAIAGATAAVLIIGGIRLIARR
jgi:hypothetical protein